MASISDRQGTPTSSDIRSRYGYLTLAVLLAGMTALAVELSASRLLGAFFGASNIIWAAIIGLILAYLALGNLIGGWWADRSPSFATFYQIAVWGAFTSSLIPAAAHNVLPSVARLNISAGVAAVIAILILFTLPVTLLGCLSPFAVRLVVADTRSSGRAVGHLYAASTIGSVIGSLVPVLLTLPAAGTTATFLIFAGILLLCALFGLSFYDRRRTLLLLWVPLTYLILWSDFVR